MADKVRLSARLWIPASEQGAPTVLEYIPYRKDDAYRRHDDHWGATLASRGVAYARVDVRGTGSSEGVITDEYSAAELDDGCAVIAWLAAQPWCSGKVGMRGLSWGGINTLQIAAMRPPALKAIMPMGCLDNRYTDDAHYIGGALAQANLQWGTSFKLTLAGPPDPAVVGEAWERLWRQRLDAAPPVIARWLGHQREDAYWRRGSIGQAWAAIEAPTYIVAGWQDTYANPVGRLLSGLTCPRKALIGLWGHTYPWMAAPLGLDWAAEEVRWWDHWLNGAETGIMDEPMVRAFMPYAAPTRPGKAGGRWIAERQWPAQTVPRRLPLGEGSLGAVAAPAAVRGDRLVGLTKPQWLDRPPTEQSWDDTRSVVFDSEPLKEPLEILGSPALDATLSADRPVAMLAARLTEVTADGRSWLVSWGLRNLTHRASHAEPEPLVPGERYPVTMPLQLIAHRFSAGSRIRLALSSGLWPMVWPAPDIATLTVEDAVLTLPERPLETAPESFLIPQRERPEPDAKPEPVRQPDDQGWFRSGIDAPPAPYDVEDVTLARGRWEASEAREDDPNSGRWSHRATSSWARGDWRCEVEASCELTSTPEAFQLTERLIARLDGVVIFQRRHRRRIDRDLM